MLIDNIKRLFKQAFERETTPEEDVDQNSQINTDLLVRPDGTLFHWQGPFYRRGMPSVWVSDDDRFTLSRPVLWNVEDRVAGVAITATTYSVAMRWVKEQYKQ